MKRAVSTMLALAVAMLGLSAFGAPPPAAAAATSLDGFEDILVDESHDRVFISTGTEVVVTDLAGQQTATIASLAETAELALSPDQSTLYVGRPTQHAVTAIDTVTLAVTHHATPDRCPTSLAPVSAGVVWFTSICDPSPTFHNGTVHALETVTGEVSAAKGESHYYDPWIESTPAAGDVISIIERGISPGQVWLYDTSVNGLGAPLLTQRATRQTESLRTSALRPDGTGIIVAEYGDMPATFALSNLAPLGPRYQMGTPYVVARNLAFSADGWLAADGTVFAPGEYEPFKEEQLDWGFGRTDLGIAWDQQRLYVVTAVYDEYDDRYEEHRLQVMPVRADSRVSVTVPDDKVPIGSQVPVTVRLETPSTARRVKLVAISPDGERTLLGTPVVDADGVTIRANPRHNTVYRAVYAGDESTDPAQGEVAVEVKGKVSVSTRSPRHVGGVVDYFRSGDTVTFVARVRAFRPSCLTYQLEVRRVVQWLSTDIAGCARIEDGRARFRLRSRAGEEYFRMRMGVWVEPTDYNIRSNADFQQVQFCPNRVPCDPPEGYPRP